MSLARDREWLAESDEHPVARAGGVTPDRAIVQMA
jgi:hypothetical protein